MTAVDVDDQVASGRGDDALPAAQRATLKEAALSSARSLTLIRAGSQLLRFGSSVVVAHFVLPAEMGHVAIALIFCAIAQNLATHGLGAPLIQRKTIAREDLESAVLVSVAGGVVLSVLVFALTPPLLTPIFGGATVRLIRLAAVMFTLTGLSVVPQTLLERRLEFRRLSFIEGASELALATVNVSLAVAGFGGKSLIIGSLAAAAMVTILCLFSARGGWPRWHRGKAREQISFGGPAALASILELGYRNIDYVMLGARLPAAQVGYYFRAFALGVDYQQRVSSIAVRIAFPVYSRAANLADMRAIRARVGRTQATLVFPGLALLVALAPSLVPAVFGEAWRPSVVPTQILAVGGMFALMRMTTTPFLLALKKPRALLGFNLFAVVFYGAVVLAATPFGLTFICAMVVGAQLVLLLASFGLLVRLGGVAMSQLWDEAAAGTIGAAALTAATWPFAMALNHAGMPWIVTVLLASAAGLGVYASTLRCFFPAAWQDLLMVLRRVLPSIGFRPSQTRTTPASR